MLVVAVLFLSSIAVLPAMEIQAKGPKPGMDPFRVLIEKERRVDPQPAEQPQVEELKQVVLPRLDLRVQAIASEDGNAVAVINYGGQSHIVEAGWRSKDGKARVENVSKDGLSVYHVEAKRSERFCW
jgi:hypothetical protein